MIWWIQTQNYTAYSQFDYRRSNPANFKLLTLPNLFNIISCLIQSGKKIGPIQDKDRASSPNGYRLEQTNTCISFRTCATTCKLHLPFRMPHRRAYRACIVLFTRNLLDKCNFRFGLFTRAVLRFIVRKGLHRCDHSCLVRGLSLCGSTNIPCHSSICVFLTLQLAYLSRRRFKFHHAWGVPLEEHHQH